LSDAAIDEQFYTSDVGAVVGSKEHGRLAEIIGVLSRPSGSDSTMAVFC
jgi:hypothetical protein